MYTEPVSHFKYRIGRVHSGIPVGYDHNCPVPALFHERLQDDAFIQRIKIAGRLVKQHERSVVKESPRDAYSLPLTPGESVSEFSDCRIITVRKRLNKVVDCRLLSRPNDFYAGSAGFTDQNVIGNTVVEQMCLLLNERFRVAELSRCDMPDILAGDHDPALLNVKEAHKQFQYR